MSMLPAARPDQQVGIRFVPGGADGYRAAVRRHTTTGLSPEEIHQIGLDALADLQDEWAELGGNVLGTSRCPVDPRPGCGRTATLRFTDAAEIVRTVTDALDRAEDAHATTGSRRMTSPAA